MWTLTPPPPPRRQLKNPFCFRETALNGPATKRVVLGEPLSKMINVFMKKVDSDHLAVFCYQYIEKLIPFCINSFFYSSLMWSLPLWWYSKISGKFLLLWLIKNSFLRELYPSQNTEEGEAQMVSWPDYNNVSKGLNHFRKTHFFQTRKKMPRCHEPHIFKGKPL